MASISSLFIIEDEEEALPVKSKPAIKVPILQQEHPVILEEDAEHLVSPKEETKISERQVEQQVPKVEIKIDEEEEEKKIEDDE